MKTTRLYQWNN